MTRVRRVSNRVKLVVGTHKKLLDLRLLSEMLQGFEHLQWGRKSDPPSAAVRSSENSCSAAQPVLPSQF